MMYETLSCDLSEQILTITLNRPDKLNAFTVTMANELISAFNAASENDDVRVIIVTGAGRAFCAGMDLAVSGNVFGLDETQHPTMKDMNERLDDPIIVKGVRDTGGRVSLAIFNCKKPIIGAINGAAVGVGLNMQNLVLYLEKSVSCRKPVQPGSCHASSVSLKHLSGYIPLKFSLLLKHTSTA